MQPLPNQIDLITDPAPPPAQRPRQRHAARGPDRQPRHHGVAIPIDDLVHRGAQTREHGLIGQPADAQGRRQAQQHHQRGGEDDGPRGEADVGPQPAVGGAGNDGAERGGGAGVRVPEGEAAGHFEVEDAEGPVLDEVDGVGGGGGGWRGEVGVQGDDEVGFHEEGDERGEEDGDGGVEVEEAQGEDGGLGGAAEHIEECGGGKGRRGNDVASVLRSGR